MNFIFKPIYFILLTGFLFQCATRDEHDHDEASETAHDENIIALSQEQLHYTKIEYGKLSQRAVSGSIKVNGMLDVPPQQLISISTPWGGFIKQTSLLQGTRVKKGQTIAIIENPEFITIQQNYLEADAQYTFYKAEYERQQTLSEEHVSAVKTFQQSKANYQTWLSKRNGLLATLKLLRLSPTSIEQGDISSTIAIVSPIDGYVTEVNVNIGKFVTPTDVIFEIVDTEHLHAELTVFEKDIPKLKLNQTVRFTLANEDEERLAHVYLIGRKIADDRSVRVHCHLEEDDAELIPGMYLKAMIETSSSTVWTLPQDAVVEYQGQSYVVIKRDDGTTTSSSDETKDVTFEIIPVHTGLSDAGYTAVPDISPTLHAATFVTKGAYAILSQQKNADADHGH
jgi:cobalt-zinc-cadmium efflux system membrane fusion protein